MTPYEKIKEAVRLMDEAYAEICKSVGSPQTWVPDESLYHAIQAFKEQMGWGRK